MEKDAGPALPGKDSTAPGCDGRAGAGERDSVKGEFLTFMAGRSG